jgi:hypothetical protein
MFMGSSPSCERRTQPSGGVGLLRVCHERLWQRSSSALVDKRAVANHRKVNHGLHEHTIIEACIERQVEARFVDLSNVREARITSIVGNMVSLDFNLITGEQSASFPINDAVIVRLESIRWLNNSDHVVCWVDQSTRRKSRIAIWGLRAKKINVR